jgi:8-oxo-dGTP pyrophosphatase MutT (NUDIX family)
VQEQKRLSAGTIVVHCFAGEFRYLLLRAYRYWDFPKGLIEPDEPPLAAASREVREETGLSNLDFCWGDAHFETEPYAGGKIARYYVALSLSPVIALGISPELGRPEHDEYRWLTYKEAALLLVPRVRAALDWAHALIGEHC